MASSNERALELIARFGVDNPSLQRAKRALDDYRREYGGLSRVQEQVRQQYERSVRTQLDNAKVTKDNAQFIDLLRSEMAGLNNAQQENIKTNEQSAEQTKENTGLWERYTKAVREAAKAEQERAAGGVVTAQSKAELRGFREEGRFQSFALQNLGSILPGGGGAAFQQFTGLFNLLDTIPKLDLSFKTLVESVKGNIGALGGAGVGLIGGLAALAAATLAYNEINREASQLVNMLIATQRQYFEVVAVGTRDQLVAARDAQETQVAILRAVIREQQNIFQRLEEQAGAVGRGLADVLDAGGVRTYREELQKNEAALRSAEFLLGRYNAAIESNATAARDGANAIIEVAEEARRRFDNTVRGQIAATNEEIAFNQRALQLRRTGTQEQLQQLQQQLNDESLFNEERIRRLQALAGSSEIAAAELGRLRGRQEQLAEQTVILRDTIAPVIELREREAAAAKALTDVTTQYFSALEKEGQARQALLIAQQAYADGLAATQAKIAEINDELARRRDEAAAALQEGLSEAELRAAETRIKHAEDAADQLARIERKYQSTLLQSIGDRDALTAFQAKQARDEQLKDQKDAQSKQERELQKSLQKQFDTLQKQYNKQLQAADTAAQRALQLESTRWQRELQLRQQAISAAETQLKNFVFSVNAIMNQLNMQRAGLTGGTAGGPPVSMPSGPGSPTTVTLPNGTTQAGWAVPYSTQPTVSSGSQAPMINYAPQVNGQTRTQVEQQMNQMQHEFLNQVYGTSNRR